VSSPFFDPEALKRCVMQPAEAAAFKAKAVKRYVIHVDADERMLMEEADTDLLRARLIMEVALLRFSRWSLRKGEQYKMPRAGDYPPAVQSVMDKMRTFLSGVTAPSPSPGAIHSARIQCKLLLGLQAEDMPPPLRQEIEALVTSIALASDEHMKRFHEIANDVGNARQP
jgi:hypothetical protein